MLLLKHRGNELGYFAVKMIFLNEADYVPVKLIIIFPWPYFYSFI